MGNGREMRAGLGKNTGPVRAGRSEKKIGGRITKRGEIFGKWTDRVKTSKRPPV